MTKEEFLDRFWLKENEGIGGYNNMYVTVTILGQLSQEEREKLEDYLYSHYSGEAMYGKCDSNVTQFDLHKTCCVACDFSKLLSGHIVVEDCGWECMYFDVWRDGEVYDNYAVKWTDDEPEPTNDCGYSLEDEDEEERYYDCFLTLEFESEDGRYDLDVGAGLCDEETYEMCLEKIARHPSIKLEEDVER